MSKEDLILKRLDEIEAKVALVHERAVAAQNLQHDLQPVMSGAFKLLLRELEDVEAEFQLEDLFDMLKTTMRNVKNLAYMLNQLNSILSLSHTVEPLLKTGMSKTITYLDDLDQKGIFRAGEAMLNLGTKVTQKYGPEEIEQLGDVLVFMIDMLNKLSDPKLRNMIEKATDAFAAMDLDRTQECGPFGMVRAMCCPEAKQGLGVMIELTKTLGKLK